MARTERVNDDKQLQILDVHIVDALAQLEALLRHSHSIQRALLKLRDEAPPPTPTPTAAALDALRSHADEMAEDCETLLGIIADLSRDIEALAKADPEPAG
jgi:hypothetical protein